MVEQKDLNIWQREPVAIIGGFTVIIEAFIAMLMALGVIVLTVDQMAAIMAFVAAVGTVATLFMRSQVYPSAKVESMNG